MLYYIKALIFGRRWDRKFIQEMRASDLNKIESLKLQIAKQQMEINILRQMCGILEKKHSSVHKTVERENEHCIIELIRMASIHEQVSLEFVLHIISKRDGKHITYWLYARESLQKRTIYLDDIQAEIGCGYNSLLLQSLIEFAKSQKPEIERITGFLAACDLETHKDRLYRFYKKHGFQIIDRLNDPEKTILYKL